MQSTVKNTLIPVFKELEITEDFDLSIFQLENKLVVFLPEKLIFVVKKNPKKFYSLTEKLSVEKISYVSNDPLPNKIAKNLKVSRNYLKKLAKDIVFPQLCHGFFIEASDMGNKEIYHVTVENSDEETLNYISKVYTEITGMKSKFLVSNRTDN